jgi:hypothetical protein
MARMPLISSSLRHPCDPRNPWSPAFSFRVRLESPTYLDNDPLVAPARPLPILSGTVTFSFLSGA